MTTDPRTIAVRLGIDEATVRELQARGYLLRLDATEAEIRERLLIAHLGATRHPSRGERPVSPA
jgi:hypothetical protein